MLTEGTAPAYEGERKAQRAAMVPLRRVGTPLDIANAVAASSSPSRPRTSQGRSSTSTAASAPRPADRWRAGRAGPARRRSLHGGRGVRRVKSRRGMFVKLDLLYEFQPKVKPWDAAAPVRPARGRADDLRRGDRADPARRQARASTPSGSSSTTSARAARRRRARGRSSAGSRRRPRTSASASASTLMPFGFIHPARVAEKVATVDILSHGRVEWGTGRSTPMEQTAFGVPTDDRSREQWKEAIEIVVRHVGGASGSPTRARASQLPRARADAQAVPGPAPAGVAGRRRRDQRRQRRRARPRAAVVRALQPVEKMAEHIGRPTARRRPRRDASRSRASRNDRVGAYTLVHCCDDIDEAADYGLWESVELVVPEPRRVHARVGAARPAPRRSRSGSSRC